MVTWRPVAKTLIKYITINWWKMKKRKSQLILSLQAKNRSWNDENAIGFKWSDVKEENEGDTTLAYFSKSLQKQVDEETFPKK